MQVSKIGGVGGGAGDDGLDLKVIRPLASIEALWYILKHVTPSSDLNSLQR